MQNNGHYAIYGHFYSRSPILVPIDRAYATSFSEQTSKLRLTKFDIKRLKKHRSFLWLIHISIFWSAV